MRCTRLSVITDQKFKIEIPVTTYMIPAEYAWAETQTALNNQFTCVLDEGQWKITYWFEVNSVVCNVFLRKKEAVLHDSYGADLNLNVQWVLRYWIDQTPILFEIEHALVHLQAGNSHSHVNLTRNLFGLEFADRACKESHQLYKVQSNQYRRQSHSGFDVCEIIKLEGNLIAIRQSIWVREIKICILRRRQLTTLGKLIVSQMTETNYPGSQRQIYKT